MAIIELKIDSVLGGQSPMYHGAGPGQFLASQAIDPEGSLSRRPSGEILPITYATFSGAGPSGAPMWIANDPVDEKTYAYMSDGELISYSSTLGSETVIGSPTNGNGSGLGYMNDYLILPTTTDVSLYGPLSGAAAFVNTWWTGTAGLTALTNTTYPTIRNVQYPNHAGHLHTDGKFYFVDYNGTQGLIHKLGVTSAGANDGSGYNVLDLPNGVRPFDIESFGTDLAVVGSVLGTSTTARQGQSWLFLWDTTSDSFYRQVPIPVSFISGIANVNGELRIWGGSVDFGWQMLRYTGGYSVEQLWDSHEGSPPYAGAIDVYGGRVMFGSYQTTIGGGANVLAHGSQNVRLGTDPLHNVAIVANLASGTVPVISSLKFAQQAQATKYPVVGWRTSSDYGLSKLDATAAKQSYFWGPNWKIDQNFKVREVRIPLTGAIDSTVSITPTLFYDDAAQSKQLAAINNTNYPSATTVDYKMVEIESGYTARNNLFLQLAFTGTSAIGAALPITVVIETLDD